MKQKILALAAMLMLSVFVIVPAQAANPEADKQLLEAAESGDVAGVKATLNNGADVDAKDNGGWTPLHLAIQTGHTEIAKQLIKHNANVNAQTDFKWTPLHEAAYKGNPEIAKWLIKRNANVNAKDNEGATPLHYTAKDGHNEITYLLLIAGAGDLNVVNNKGWTPLMEVQWQCQGGEIAATPNRQAAVKLIHEWTKDQAPIQAMKEKAGGKKGPQNSNNQ